MRPIGIICEKQWFAEARGTLMRMRQLLYGMATFVPGVSRAFDKGTGGTNSARYCYSVWLRHLVLAHNNGLSSYPRVVAELGPGDSIGIGLAALISGADRYFAFDIIEYATIDQDLIIFHELLELFRNRVDIPSAGEFPRTEPLLVDYRFPENILTEERLRASLAPPRIEAME
jgi:hypothetical protein